MSSWAALISISFIVKFIRLSNALSFPGAKAVTTLAQQEAIIHNLNAVVSHIQNLDLYSPSWANRISFHHDDTKMNTPIAKCDVNQGEIITLYPIQCISIGKDIMDNEILKSEFKTKESILSKRIDLLQKERYPYPYLRTMSESIYMHVEKDLIRDGWYGNIIPSTSTTNTEETTTDTKCSNRSSNCRFIPLPSVAPLCGIVATKSITKGEDIISTTSSALSHEGMHKLTNDIAKKYANELGELLPYLQMAYTTADIQTNDGKSKRIRKKQKYHMINQKYPNVKKIHTNPNIYTINDFLSADECERIIQKAKLNIQLCLVKNENTGVVEIDPSRTSTNANIPQREVPSVTNKILNLCNCIEEQLETFQVLNYKNGQEFKAHTDGFDGPTTACGFQDSGRIATIFCYLNDVSTGGNTLFTKLKLDINPKRGMAVIHFPMSLDLIEDKMTEHQGSIAIDEKWILTTWIWKHYIADYRYSDDNIESLSGDII